MASPVSPITPAQIIRLRTQLGVTQAQFADRLRAADPLIAANQPNVARWESGRITPNAHAQAAIARLWLHEGYPCTTDGRDASLTTNHAASSWGQPVILLDGVAHGSAEVGPIGLGDAPVAVAEAATRAGYEVAGER